MHHYKTKLFKSFNNVVGHKVEFRIVASFYFKAFNSISSSTRFHVAYQKTINLYKLLRNLPIDRQIKKSR